MSLWSDSNWVAQTDGRGRGNAQQPRPPQSVSAINKLITVNLWGGKPLGRETGQQLRRGRL